MPTQNEALLEAYASCPPSARKYPTDCDTFAAWLKTTLNNGTARFTMNVWLGTALVNKVCQFIKPGSNLIYAWASPEAIDVTMTLRVFDV